MPERIVVKIGMNITLHEAISMEYFLIPRIVNLDTPASQILLLY